MINLIIIAIKFYFVYGLVSATLGMYWSREDIGKIIQKRREEGKTNTFAFLIVVFTTSMVIWPYIVGASIKHQLTRNIENLK